MSYTDLHDTDHIVKFKTGVAANINATATKNTATEGEPHWTTDTDILYIYDGTQNLAVGNIVPTTRVTTTYTVLVTDRVVYCDTDGGAFTATLPAGVEGQTFRLINCGSAGLDLTIDGNGAETVRGAATQIVSDSEIMILVYNATEGWW